MRSVSSTGRWSAERPIVQRALIAGVLPERPDRTVNGTAVDIAEAPKLAWDNKLNKGFNTTDIPVEFGLLDAEVGEACTAWRMGLPDSA